MLNPNKYKNFDERAFICDRHFQDWVMYNTGEYDDFWKNFFEAHPEQREAGEAAREFLLCVQFTEEHPDDTLIEKAFAKHQADIQRIKKGKLFGIKFNVAPGKLLRIAAVFGGVILMVTALLLFSKREQPVLVKADYGHLKSIILPDSSSVVLNGNSTIRFAENWNSDRSREVWLEGEAFFDIRHLNKDTGQLKDHERFIVHTNDLTVEVLGTSFNIRQRRGKTEVVLQSGTIKISFANGRDKDNILSPGDRISYDAGETILEKGIAEAENSSAWKDKKLLLNDPTTAEVIEYLEDVFGKKLVLSNPELATRKIEGPILLTTLDDALFVLSTVLNAEIIKQDSTIIIRSR